MRNYESDISRFVREMKDKDPELERRQREGRAIYWDKQLDLDDLRRWNQSKISMQGYVYQTQTK